MADGNAQIELFSGDITTLAVDAVVNAANTALAPGAGVCGAIHRAAGPRLAEECATLGGCPTGEARITGGYDLPAGHVIHTVGPVWNGGTSSEADLLASCYRNTLLLAAEHNLTSVAFPAISTGVYSYPLAEATDIAIATTRDSLPSCPGITRVVFCTFGEEATAAYRFRLGDDGSQSR